LEGDLGQENQLTLVKETKRTILDKITEFYSVFSSLFLIKVTK